MELKVDYKSLHKDIIEKSRLGDQQACYQLYQLYNKAMFSICYRMLNNFEEAEDLLQEIFVEAFSKLDQFRFESTFGAWLKQIVVNRCINRIKKRKLELTFPEEAPQIASEDSNELKDNEMNIGSVTSAIQKLPEGYRIVLSLYLIEGYDHREIAEILSIKESTSKSQYMRAKSKLKEIIKTEQYEAA